MNTYTTGRLGRAVVAVAALVVIFTIVACSSDGDAATSTATPEPTETASPTVPPGLPGDVDPTPGGPVDAAELAAYEAARATWDAAALDSYQFTLNRNCFCPPEFRGPFEITVENGVATSALYEGQPANDGVETTVDDVFDEIERALNRGVLVEISYDAVDSHPRAVRLDLSAIAADGGLSLDLGDLKPID